MDRTLLLVEGCKIEAQIGATIMECLVEAGLLLRTDCGGRGRCGKCTVREVPALPSGLSPPDGEEIKKIGSAEQAAGYRLACRAKILGPTSLEIPAESRLAREVVQKGLPMMLPQLQTAGQASTAGQNGWGVAVDVGTTTIAVYLCDLAGSGVSGSTSVRNPQSIFGDDVISRLTVVRQDMGMLPRLQKMAVGAIDWAIRGLARQAGIEPDSITEIVCVGNSIMLHMLLGVDPCSIGVYPYEPKFSAAMDISAAAIGLNFGPDCRLRTLPLMSGYLGADIVSAALAADLDHARPGTMLVDIGTNGEVILFTENGFSATSCATGPAFEGATIRDGMQATSGAIDSIRIDPETRSLEYTLIQRMSGPPKAPAGICGSGVISAAAEFLRSGAIRKCGRFEMASGFPWLKAGEAGIPEAEIVPAEATGTGHSIAFTQADVRAVQLAKGALQAGIELLCAENGISRPSRLLIAGAFGSFINRADALRIGMFPEMDVDDIEVVGNAAGAGAMLALMREDFFEKAREIAASARVLDLASHPRFQETFINALSF